MNKIALEEHFLTPGLIEHWRTTAVNISPELGDKALEALQDFSSRRLDSMDRNGIGFAVLSIAGPGVQVESDPLLAGRLAREANDVLAKEIRARPTRYGGFAHLAMQNPEGAADELERCVREMGFCGAMINGQTNGRYLDHDSFAPFLGTRCRPRGASLYSSGQSQRSSGDVSGTFGAVRSGLELGGRDRDTRAAAGVCRGVRALSQGPTDPWAHGGSDTVPAVADRRAVADCQSQWTQSRGAAIAYIKRNIFVTTSGVCSAEPLLCALSALGEDRVMFSADYPFEDAGVAARFLDTAPISEAQRQMIGFETAAALLGIRPPAGQE